MPVITKKNRVRLSYNFIILSFAIPIFFISYGESIAADRVQLISNFNEMDQSLNNGEGYSTYTNESGTLAWAESYLLEAYLDMFEATQDVKYLNSFVRHADRVVASTDFKRGIADYKGRSIVGWSATKYSNDKERVVWLVHSGMITYPLVRFAWLVDKKQLEAYRLPAKSYTELAKTALSTFDSNWVYDPLTKGGYYQFFADEPHPNNNPSPPMPLPFNQQLAAGRTFIMLYNVTGNIGYRNKAEGLAKHFRGNLRKGRDSYVWSYWYSKGFARSKAIEDISHGAIDLDFAILAYRSNIVFGRKDMSKFRATYEKQIHKSGSVANRVDNSGDGKYKNAVGRWLELSEFTCAPYGDFYDFYSSGTLKRHPEVMLGVAKLVKYFDKCNK